MADVKTTEELYNDLIKRNNSGTKSNSLGMDSYFKQYSKSDKIDFSEISPYKSADIYETLNDGTRVAKFEDYIAGTNNEERLAQGQSTGDKWLNGIEKLGLKTGTAILGGTLGTANGVLESISQGSLSAMYDNDFSKWLDRVDTKLNYKLPNYYTQQEKDAGFVGSLGSANFWANDVFGGLSFTLGAIVSEGIWAATTGGTSLASVGARWGTKALGLAKTAKGLSTFKSILKEVPEIALKSPIGVESGIVAGRLGAGTNALRFAVTSTGYEAGVEALHFKKEAEENFIRDFQDKNGRLPDADELMQANEKITDASNGVFALNTAILIPSNIAMFGRNVLGGLPSPFKGVTREVNKGLFGIGTEVVGNTTKVLQASKFQNFAKKAFVLGKPLATEGIYEEGGQGVASKLMGKWLESQYNPEAHKNTFNMFQALGESMGEQYGTKEGWKELGIGMLIGGGTSIVMGTGKAEIQQAESAQKEFAEYQNTYQGMTLQQKGIMSSQIQTAVKNAQGQEAKRETAEAHLSANEALIAQMDYKMSVGEDLGQLSKEYATTVNAVTNEEYKDAGIDEEFVDEYKQTLIDAHKNLSQRYKKNRTYADLLVGSRDLQDYDQQVKSRALAYALTQGENSNILLDDIITTMEGSIDSTLMKSLRNSKELSNISTSTKTKINSVTSKIKAKQAQVKTLEAKLRKAQARPTKVEEVKSGGTKADQNKFFDLSEQLLKASEDLNSYTQELDDITAQLNSESDRRNNLKNANVSGVNFGGESITTEDLLTLDENIVKLKDVIESYKEIDSVEYNNLTDLLKQYDTSMTNFKGYQEVSLGLINNNFNLKSSNTWIGKKLQKSTLNEFTNDFFARLGEYEKQWDTNLNQYIAEQLKEDWWDKFQADGTTPEFVLQDISQKIIREQSLDKREEKVFEVKQEEINQLIKEFHNKPNLDNISKEEYEEELEKLTKAEELEIRNNGLSQEEVDELNQLEEETVTKGSVNNDNILNLISKVDPNKVYNLEEALDIINKNTRVSYKAKNILTTLEPILNTVNVGVVFSTGSSDRTSSGYYTPTLNQIDISLTKALENNVSTEDIYKTFVHELVHASFLHITRNEENLTSELKESKDKLEEFYYYVKESGKLKEKINQFVLKNNGYSNKEGYFYEKDGNIVKFGEDEGDYAKIGLYGLTNLDEFLAESTNQKLLEFIDIIDEKQTFNMIDFLFKKENKQYNKNTLTQGLKELTTNFDKNVYFKNLRPTSTEPNEESAGRYVADLVNNKNGKRLFDLKRKKDKKIEPILRKYNVKRQKLKGRLSEAEVIEPTDLKEALKQRINKAVKDRFFPLEPIGQNADELLSKKPTQKDVNRYQELISKSKTRSKEEQVEWEELRDKLSNWRLIDSARIDDNQTIADLLDILSALETVVEAEDTLDNLDDDIELYETEDKRETQEQHRPDILNNPSGGAFVKIMKGSDGVERINFSHLKARTLIDKLIQNVSTFEIKELDKETAKGYSRKPTKVLTDALLNKNQEVAGTIFIIGSTEISVEKGGVLSIPLEQYREVQDQLGFVYFDPQAGTWSFYDLYETLPDGTKIKKLSDFQSNIESEKLYDSEAGDYLKTFVDVKTAWNVGLLNDALQDIEKEDKISEKTLEKINNSLEITVEGGGTLKAKTERTTDDAPLEIRRRFAEKFISNIEENRSLTGYQNIELGIELPIKEMYLGTPDLILDVNNKPIEIEFSENAVKEIITQGYTEDGEVVLADKKYENKVTRQFVINAEKANKGKKIPVVVFKKGKHFIAYPISMVKTESPRVAELENILSLNIQEVEKVKKINELLIEAKINPSLYNLIALDEEVLNRIENALAEITTFTTASELASAEYDKNRLTTEARIKIDLTNITISSPKVTVDFSKAVMPMTEVLREELTETRKALTQDLLDIQRNINTSIELSDKNKFVQAFDENAIQNKTSDIMNRRNVNFLMDLYFEKTEKGGLRKKVISGDALKVVSKEKLEDIRKRLERIMFIESQAKVKKTQEEVETENDLGC